MKDHHLRTVQKDHENINRKLKWSTEHSRTQKKNREKGPDSALTDASEDILIQSAKDSIDKASISELLDENQLIVSPQSPVNSLSADVSPSVASTSSDLCLLYSTITSDISSITSDFSPLASTITSNKVQTKNVDVNHGTADSSEIVKGDSLKAEIFARKFREAGSQSLKPNDMILLSENVMEVLLRAVIQDLQNLPAKREWFAAIVQKKVYIVLKKVLSIIMTLMLLIIVMGVLVFSAGNGGSYHKLVPT